MKTTATNPADVELQHRPGCPVAEGRRLGDPDDPSNPRKGTLRIEAYIVTGTGQYNRTTGEYGAPPKKGVVRCLECAAQAIVNPEDVPALQALLLSIAEGDGNA